MRCFSMERDAEFVYLALERCASALHDVVEPSLVVTATLQSPAKMEFISDEGPTSTAWAVARDIGEGLAFLHSRGFVHRDLKPHNVLLADNGRHACTQLPSRCRAPPRASAVCDSSSSNYMLQMFTYAVLMCKFLLVSWRSAATLLAAV